MPVCRSGHVWSVTVCCFTGRDHSKLSIVEQYLRKNGMFRNYTNADEDPTYSKVWLFFVMINVTHCVSGQPFKFDLNEMYIQSYLKRLWPLLLYNTYLIQCVELLLSILFQIVELDLATVVPCCSGPKRPHDRVSVSEMKTDFNQCLNSRVGFKVGLFLFPYSQI